MYDRTYNIYFPSPVTPFYKAVCPDIRENVYSLADTPEDALRGLQGLIEEHLHERTHAAFSSGSS